MLAAILLTNVIVALIMCNQSCSVIHWLSVAVSFPVAKTNNTVGVVSTRKGYTAAEQCVMFRSLCEVLLCN